MTADLCVADALGPVESDVNRATVTELEIERDSNGVFDDGNLVIVADDPTAPDATLYFDLIGNPGSGSLARGDVADVFAFHHDIGQF